MTKGKELNKNPHGKDSHKALNAERNSKGAESPPSSFSQGLIRIIWKSKWRKYYLLALLPFIFLYIIWATFPDSAKENLLRKVCLLGPIDTETSVQDDTVAKNNESPQNGNYSRLGNVNKKFIDMIKMNQFFDPESNDLTIKIVPIVELKRGNRFIIFLWPIPFSLKDGEIIDDDIYAVHILEKTIDSFEIVKIEKTSTGSEQPLLDYTVRERFAGVPLSDLGSKFITNMEKFSTAMSDRDLDYAVNVAVDMTRLFELHTILFDDMVTEILINSTKLKPGELVYSGIQSDGNNTFIEFRSTATEHSEPFRLRTIMVNEQKGLWVYTGEE